VPVPDVGGKPVAFRTGEFHRVWFAQAALRALVLLYLFSNSWT
jgi:hypothetical protein